MSYDIVRSINEKERTVTCAANNLRPLYYSKQSLGDITTERFRQYVITGLLFGDLHFSNKTHLYSIVTSKIRALPEYKELHDKIWNFDNHYTDEWCQNHYHENMCDLYDLIIKVFNETKSSKRESWVLTNSYCYLKRLNVRTYSLCYTKENAKIFGSKELAVEASRHLNGSWSPLLLSSISGEPTQQNLTDL